MRPNHALEDRSPSCPNCRAEMQWYQWYRSELVQFVPATVLHLFNCRTCSVLAETETVQERICVTPDFAKSHVRFLHLAA
jgi:hypothetical protein